MNCGGLTSSGDKDCFSLAEKSTMSGPQQIEMMGLPFFTATLWKRAMSCGGIEWGRGVHIMQSYHAVISYALPPAASSWSSLPSGVYCRLESEYDDWHCGIHIEMARQNKSRSSFRNIYVHRVYSNIINLKFMIHFSFFIDKWNKTIVFNYKKWFFHFFIFFFFFYWNIATKKRISIYIIWNINSHSYILVYS